MDRNLYFCCQAPGTSIVVLSLQTQAGTYSGYLVCPATETLHPLIFQDVAIKGLSALLLSTFIFVSTARASVNKLFFPLTTCLFCFLQKQMTEVSRMAVNWMRLHPYHTAEYGPTNFCLPPPPQHPMPTGSQHSYTQRIWDVLVKIPPQVPSTISLQTLPYLRKPT